MTDEHENKPQRLTGRDNYLQWSKLTHMKLLSTGAIVRKDIEEAGYPYRGGNNASMVKGMQYILSGIDLRCVDSFDVDDDLITILKKLNDSFGFGNVEPWTIKREIKDIAKFPIDTDPSGVFLKIDKKLAEFKSAGGVMSPQDLNDILVEGLEHHDWWFLKGTINEANGIDQFSNAQMKEKIQKWWNNFRKAQVGKVSINHVDQKRKEKRKEKVKEPCGYCREKFPQAPWRANSHHEKDCKVRFKLNVLNVNSDNRGDINTYSSIKSAKYHDSGATRHFFNEKPKKIFRKCNIDIYTAGKSQPPIQAIGVGDTKIGKLLLKDVLYVPEIGKNLVSGIQLMKDGYIQEINNNTLLVKKNEKVVASAEYQEKTNLLKFIEDEECNMTLSEGHKILGHVANAKVKQTQKCTTGLDIMESKIGRKYSCCVQGQSTCKNKPKQSIREYELLSVIESDIQGPFPIRDINGTVLNLKFIDCSSGWAKMYLLKNSTSATVKDKFVDFQTRMERQTGKKIKRLRVDGGHEYYGDLLTYTSNLGIVKEKGTPYDHHFPARAERLHRTVLRHANTMLFESKLPARYYGEAQLTFIYLYNRMPHSGSDKTPYELIYGCKPNLSHLKPFGCICYAFIPPEKRSKLEKVRDRCRLLGYADDDDIEEIKGYKLLREDDMEIIYSSDVIFDMDAIPTTLEDIQEEQTVQENTVDADYVPEESDEEEDDDMSIVNDPELMHPTSDESEAIATSEEDSEEMEANATIHEEKVLNNWLLCNQTITDLFNSSLDMPCDMIYEAFLATSNGDPATYEEAINSVDKEHWIAAMEHEMASINENGTYIIEDLPKAKPYIGCKWVFKTKLGSQGEIIKYKARLVAKGFNQQYGINFHETFAPVLKFKTLRTIIAIAANNGWKLYQDDVVTAFLNGELEDEVWMKLPPGFEQGGGYCRLVKALYGTKQAPREWNRMIDSFLKGLGFKQSQADPCLYFSHDSEDTTLLSVYVDDIVTTGSNSKKVAQVRKDLRNRFKMDDGGELRWYLGMDIQQLKDSITLNQSQYLKQKLEQFKAFIGAKTAKTPLSPEFQELLIKAQDQPINKTFPYREMVGSLMYAMVATRPDICTAVGVVSRFLDKPTDIHCEMVRQIFRYLKQTTDYCLKYTPSGTKLTGYVDASYANCEDYSSISGYVTLLGSNILSWQSGKQRLVALSSAESEYMALTPAIQEVLWLKDLLQELKLDQKDIKLYEDNQACIALAKNPQDHRRTRHIQVKYHFCRQHIEDKQVELIYCPTKSQLADVFTKGFSGPQMLNHRTNLKLYPLDHSGGELKSE
jgi:hypothetical protein